MKILIFCTSKDLNFSTALELYKVSLKLKNGSTDLNNYFFILFALLQGWFKMKKKSEKLPGKLENWGKTESTFFCGNGWSDLANFFFMFVIIRMRFLCKEKLEKLPGKLENSGKTESAFLWWICISFFFCFVRFSREKVFRKKKSRQLLQRKVEKFGQTAKIIIFVCILDHN
jgi:hypothetical protein